MDRATKLIVIASNLAGIWLLVRQVSGFFPQLFAPAVIAFAASAAGALLCGDIVVAIILPIVYFVPALCFAWFGSFLFAYYAIWLAAMNGAMLSRSVRSTWAFPVRWRGPLVLWALTLALSWPIIVLREVDFVPALFDATYLSNARMGASPPTVMVWVLTVASIVATGLLLLDWLFLAYPASQIKRFESRIVWPLFAGAGVASVVAVYQMFVDMSFLNRTLFWTLGRAVGVMRDANAFGMVIALWVPIAGALVVEARARRTMAVYSVVFVTLGLAVWASGSRTALLAATVGLFVLFANIRRSLKLRQVLVGAGAVAALVVFVVVAVPASTTGPWRRIVQFLPDLSGPQLQVAAKRLWTRDMYGTVADQMIAEHPLVGIGVGGYQYQAADILYLINHADIRVDNAQNWYRQQLAELGLLGSVGWIVLLAMVAWMLLFRQGPERHRAIVGAVKGSVVGLALASLLGIPTQETATSMTFVVLAAWCLKLTGAEQASPQNARLWPERFEWPAILALLLCFLGGTAYAARTGLRPAARAVRAEFPYNYGFIGADETDPDFQWTRARAVDVFPINDRWMKLVIGAVAPDAADRPVDVKVWRNDELVLRLKRQNNFPVERWVRLPDHQKYVGLRIEVSRTWRPADFGRGTDRRERGVAIGKREFSYWPPKGAVLIY